MLIRSCTLVFIGLMLAICSSSSLAQWRWMHGATVAEFQDSDWQLLQAAAMTALDQNDDGQRSNWHNPETGNRGAVRPLSTFQHQQRSCRRVAFLNVSESGRRGQGTYSLCRASSGAWGFVSEAELER